MAVAQTATSAKGNGATKERSAGPMQLFYVDSKGAHEHKRVPTDAAGVKIVAAGKSNTFDASKLPASIKDALVVDALAKRIKIYVANHAEDDGSNVAELAQHVYSEMLAGRIYSKSEGTGAARGKKFDATLYADAWKALRAFCAKKGLKNKLGKAITAMTEDQYQDTVTKLESMTPTDRTAKVKEWTTNQGYKKALDELKLERLKKKTVDVELDNDMPF